MAKVTKPAIKINPVVVGKVFQPNQQQADIVLTNSKVKLQGTKIEIFGSANNLLATFDSKTSNFIVHKKLMVGNLDVLDKLKDLETRVKNLEP
ncbi:hypothetical protein [Aquimarina sp. Aq78]|uniref:hypothetical protein n=1 Tax=Aquimarina sp. Aq78 TaxID=1191889 RepID=UPI000D109874|nr:hypothetical protein [Aquimarina sp. Aq78]